MVRTQNVTVAYSQICAKWKNPENPFLVAFQVEISTTMDVLEITWFNLSRHLTNPDKESTCAFNHFSVCCHTLEYAPLKKTSVRPHGFKWDKSPAASLLRHIRRVSKPKSPPFYPESRRPLRPIHSPSMAQGTPIYMYMITHSSILFGFVDCRAKKVWMAEATINLTHVALHWPSARRRKNAIHSHQGGPRVSSHTAQFI
jgi:hypothetical protein